MNDPVQVTEKKTGIKFSTYGIPKEGFQKSGTFEFGMILPPQPGNEYIARVVASSKGYSGISHSTGMTKALLLVFWADKKEVKTSFQYAEYVIELFRNALLMWTEIMSNHMSIKAEPKPPP